MALHSTGCLICGKPLSYFDPPRELACTLCGKTHVAHAACEDGHYICDACHTKNGFDSITEYARGTSSKDPVAIATGMMKLPHIYMHGPEHHYLAPAALLAAYRNAGGDIDLDASLAAAQERAGGIPGGICGFWGSCGAGIGAGIFTSIISGATPLSESGWSLANLATSQALAAIAQHGGPRCCKRDVWLAIARTVSFTDANFGVTMDYTKPTCVFSHKNEECRKEHCLFHPKHQEEGNR